MAGEWERHEVSALIESGALVVGDGYRAKNSELSRSGLPFARAGNINAGFLFDDADCFPEDNISLVGNKISQPGDVVFTSKGTVGRFGFVRPDTPRFVYSPQLCFWRSVDRQLIDPRFLSFWMSGREFFVQFKGVAGQTDMAEYVSLTDQRRMHITLPPIPEQRAIAHILGTLDDKIELNRQMNETLEAMARALFKSWFVDFDPIRAKAEGRDSGLPKDLAALFPDSFEDSELGEIPKGWRASVLGEEVKRCGGQIQTGPFGSQLHASDYVADGVPVVMPKDLIQRRISTLSIARVKLSDAERLSRHRLHEGDIVYSRRGDVERHGLVRNRERGWLCGTGCLLVRLGPVWPSPLFASFALDRSETCAWIVQHAIGATMPNLNTGILSQVPILVPPDGMLRAYNRVVQPLADGVISNDVLTETLVSLRDSLLPKFFSRELRVTDDEQIVESA